jgi:hypothetical protein
LSPWRFGRLAGSSGILEGLSFGSQTTMIEINPILAQIADLKGRVESLRGYL